MSLHYLYVLKNHYVQELMWSKLPSKTQSLKSCWKNTSSDVSIIYRGS